MTTAPKRKLVQLLYLCEIKDGQLLAPRPRIRKDLAEMRDCPEVEMRLRPVGKNKTLEQLAVFHGPIIEQIQAHYMAAEGIYKCRERIKAELKDQFLPKKKQYWDDGSPVLVKIPHPEKQGVWYHWHLEQTPSLSTLTVDGFRGFIDAILSHFLHSEGLSIEIDPDQKKVRG